MYKFISILAELVPFSGVSQWHRFLWHLIFHSIILLSQESFHEVGQIGI